jgi:hypothetical protein
MTVNNNLSVNTSLHLQLPEAKNKLIIREGVLEIDTPKNKPFFLHRWIQWLLLGWKWKSIQ